jgi:hypothetical protein
MFLVIEGSFTRNPSSSFDMTIWHPNLDVSVKPKAKSSISFSSSVASSILSYIASSSTITWHVEQEQDPSHAPRLILALQPYQEILIKPAFHLYIMRLSNRQEVVTLTDCKLMLITFLINKGNI